MTALKLGITKTNSNTSSQKGSYELWREYRKNTNENYIMVPVELKEFLPHIHTQAINLYLYYFFRAKNSTGISWPSVDRAANDLSVSSRSINYWNDELEKLGLIARISENKASKLTYLLPISNFYYLEKDNSVEDVLKKYKSELTGELTHVINLFQWRSNKKTKEYTDKLIITFLVFKRTCRSKDGYKIKEVFQIVGVEKLSDDLKNVTINKKSNDFQKDVYLIDSLKSPYSVPSVSLAISTKLNLLSTKEKTTKEILQFLIEDVIENFDDLEQLDKISMISESTD